MGDRRSGRIKSLRNRSGGREQFGPAAPGPIISLAVRGGWLSVWTRQVGYLFLLCLLVGVAAICCNAEGPVLSKVFLPPSLPLCCKLRCISVVSTAGTNSACVSVVHCKLSLKIVSVFCHCSLLWTTCVRVISAGR